MAPSDLVDIGTACTRRGFINTIGVVVDKLDVYRTKGSSSCVTFTIKDAHFDTPSWSESLKIKYFNDNESVLPEIRLNDVVLLRNIRITVFQGRTTGVASQHDTVPWAIFRPGPDPNSSPSITSGPVPFELKPLEKRFAISLLDRFVVDEQSASAPQLTRRSATSRQPSQPAQPVQPSQVIQASMPAPKWGGLPFHLIQDVQVNNLAQLLGQVVKLNTWDSERCLMDIKKEKEDEQGPEGDEYNYMARKKKDWPGPWGQLTIQVAVWEPHASFVREQVKAGDLVLLTYVRIKAGRFEGGIEAAVHEDKKYPEKIHVRLVSPNYDERTRELLDRRKEYWSIHGKPSEDPRKAEKKKKSEQKKKEIRKEEGQKTLTVATSQAKKNPHIKTRNIGVPERSIDYILSGESHINNLPGGITYTLPFQNVCYVLLARVVDFFPPNLEDFTVQVPMKRIASNRGRDQDIDSTPRMEWQWRFCLLVEGTEPLVSKQETRKQMKIYVSGGDGEHLLNLDATDLRRSPGRLAELREKLFLLWGDLEEKKQAQATDKTSAWEPVKSSSVPFNCCIQEYGVECGHAPDLNAMAIDGAEQPCSQSDCFGWERRFSMFGTTIHS
ncbi:Telomere end binding protein [Penicillium atrosanguineum]|nr:Telomere end binding protein [Penicillium atrosanguineum]